MEDAGQSSCPLTKENISLWWLEADDLDIINNVIPYSVGTTFQMQSVDRFGRPYVTAPWYFMLFAKADAGGFRGFLRCENVAIQANQEDAAMHLVVEKVGAGQTFADLSRCRLYNNAAKVCGGTFGRPIEDIAKTLKWDADNLLEFARRIWHNPDEIRPQLARVPPMTPKLERIAIRQQKQRNTIQGLKEAVMKRLEMSLSGSKAEDMWKRQFSLWKLYIDDESIMQLYRDVNGQWQEFATNSTTQVVVKRLADCWVLEQAQLQQQAQKPSKKRTTREDAAAQPPEMPDHYTKQQVHDAIESFTLENNERMREERREEIKKAIGGVRDVMVDVCERFIHMDQWMPIAQGPEART